LCINNAAVSPDDLKPLIRSQGKQSTYSVAFTTQAPAKRCFTSPISQYFVARLRDYFVFARLRDCAMFLLFGCDITLCLQGCVIAQWLLCVIAQYKY
jgi:hypothetical protein